MNYSDTEANTYFNKLRAREFSRLDRMGQVYLDYTGGNLYPQTLVEKHVGFLKNSKQGTWRL
jgi:selenocysteine lyase/cysteine desulfurase